MEEIKNENLVTEQVAENVEQTTEQTPKTFTQDEVNEIVGKAKARTRAKLEKDYQRKQEDYDRLMGVLTAGTGKQSVAEVTDTLAQFYQDKGVKLPQKPSYTEKDIEILARAEAEEIIASGYEEVVEEVERLAELGVANMSQREKAVFKTLAEHRQQAERGRALSKLGVKEDVYGSKDFTDFAAMFNANTPIDKVYELYQNRQPKKEHKTMGSMKNNDSRDSKVKEFYTPEEARKFTKKDFDNNPALFKAVEASMLKWRR
jgi:hypothetical protein